MGTKLIDLNAKQEETLRKFRENVSDCLEERHDDHYLLRWLKARSFDLKKSEKMLRENLEWRKKMGADKLIATYEPPKVLLKYYPGGLCGMDKQGRPFWIDCVGRSDVKGLINSAKKLDFLIYKAYHTELIYCALEEQTQQLGRRVDQLGIIFDMEGFGMKHLWKPAVDIFGEILTMYECRYPETLAYCMVINAPRIFPIAYNMVKIFLSDDTKKKIIILGSNWKRHLLERIDSEQLPVHWGGTQTDPDGDIYCRSKVCMGGPVPTEYYGNFNGNFDTTGFIRATVGRGSSLQLDYQIEEPGQMLRYQFLTEGNDIGFGVYYRTLDERQKACDMVEIFSSERVNSHLVPENGTLPCDRTGTYVVRFDNTYSWVRTKSVSYMIEVLSPDNLEDINGSDAMNQGISESDDDI